MAYGGSWFEGTTDMGRGSTHHLDSIINEVWAPEIEREWQADLYLADFIKDVSGLYSGGGDIVNISGIYSNQLSANDKSGGSNVTLQAASMGSNTVTIDSWKEVSFIFEDMEAGAVLQDAGTAQEYADQAKYILRKAVDSAVATVLNSGLTTEVGGSGQNVTDGLIRSAIEQLDSADIDMRDMAFFFHPTAYWHDVQGEDKYYDTYTAEKSFQGNFGVMTPKVGLYGVPAYRTSQVPKSTEVNNFLVSKKAAAIAVVTPGGGVRSQSEYDMQKLGTMWISDAIFGTSSLRTDAGVIITSDTGTVVS